MAFIILLSIFSMFPEWLSAIFTIVLLIAYAVYSLSCSAVIYRNLTAEETPAEPVAEPEEKA